MQFSDTDMSERLIEEFNRLGYSPTEVAMRIYCSTSVVCKWMKGHGMPQAFNLAGLYRLGFDVIYILTGERTRNDRTGSENNR